MSIISLGVLQKSITEELATCRKCIVDDDIGSLLI